MKKVLKWVGIAVLAFIAIGVIAVATDNSPDETAVASAANPVIYKTIKNERSGDALYLRIAIDDRYDKKDLIEILRKSKEEHKWNDQLVVWFYIRHFSESGAWASAAYLPKCDNCETDKDSDGTPVQYKLFGMTKAKADSLLQYSFDSIPGKKKIASYLEDIFQCKTEVYEVNGQPNKLLLAKIFRPGGYFTQWLELKVVDGEDRYYFMDEEDDEGNYMLMEPGINVVHFRNKEGVEWQTFHTQ